MARSLPASTRPHPHGHVDADWIAEQVRFCDNVTGDIDTLSNRIKQIRTWTFVANRKNWLEDPAHWREKTRDIEDRLSDALHERLTQRFVDRRTVGAYAPPERQAYGIS
jgi:ATP-dependent RNA helicase SUPV3L1/SUV3